MNNLKHFGLIGTTLCETNGPQVGIRGFFAAEDFNRVTAERDALQELLNQRDEQVESLKQRLQGEPVAWLGSGVPFARQQDAIEYASYKDKRVRPLYAEQPAPASVALPVDPERERLMEIVQQYPNGDPLEYDAAVRMLRK